MGKKVVCENLPLDKTVREFLELLDPVGTVQWVYMVTDPNTKRPTGRAYVEMWSDTEAELVIGKWNNQKWENSLLSIRMAGPEDAPEAAENKLPVLTSPSDFVYSVIRLQLEVPEGSLIFINDVAKAIADEKGSAVVRALLPGSYEVKIVHKGILLRVDRLSVNCDEAPPLLKAGFSQAALTQPMEVAIESMYFTEAIPISRATSMFAVPKEEAENKPIPEVVTPPEEKRQRWTWVVAVVMVVLLVGGLSFPTLKGYLTPAKAKEDAPPPPPPEGMAYVPGGKFILGRVTSDDPYEVPAHEENLPSGYYMDKTEVSNEDYFAFVKDTNRTPPPHWGGKVPPASILLLPVTNVSWDDASAYCLWKGTRVGLICRLPDEKEWENAARGEKHLLYAWGNDWRDGMANANQPNGKLAPVGSTKTDINAYGLCDMTGNVREWTRDTLSIYPGSKAEPVSGVRVARGGAFSDPPQRATYTFRSFFDPNDRSYDRTGFRCLCEVPSPSKD
jgi:formylglycine-generating enzyme required for sulfatase activity